MCVGCLTSAVVSHGGHVPIVGARVVRVKAQTSLHHGG